MVNPFLPPLPPPPPGRNGWPWNIDPEAVPAVRPDGKPWPRISIVTPSFNQGEFLEQTIRSVLLQGYPNLEYLVIDGGSKDASGSILRRYSSYLSFWISEPDKGQSDAINRGFARAGGEILGWLNSDDFLTQGSLQYIADAFLKKEADVGAIVGLGHWIDKSNKVLYAPLPDTVSRITLMNWTYGSDFAQPACFFSRTAWIDCGPLRLDLNYCMDLDLWLRISDKYRFMVVPRLLAMMTAHPAAKTVSQRPKMYGETALLFASQPDGFPAARRVLADLLEGKFGRRPISFYRRLRKVVGGCLRLLGLHNLVRSWTYRLRSAGSKR